MYCGVQKIRFSKVLHGRLAKIVKTKTIDISISGDLFDLFKNIWNVFMFCKRNRIA